MRLVGSYFPHQGSNPCPLHGKHGFCTTGSPGQSPDAVILPAKSHEQREPGGLYSPQGCERVAYDSV